MGGSGEPSCENSEAATVGLWVVLFFQKRPFLFLKSFRNDFSIMTHLRFRALLQRLKITLTFSVSSCSPVHLYGDFGTNTDCEAFRWLDPGTPLSPVPAAFMSGRSEQGGVLGSKFWATIGPRGCEKTPVMMAQQNNWANYNNSLT